MKKILLEKYKSGEVAKAFYYVPKAARKYIPKMLGIDLSELDASSVKYVTVKMSGAPAPDFEETINKYAIISVKPSLVILFTKDYIDPYYDTNGQVHIINIQDMEQEYLEFYNDSSFLVLIDRSICNINPEYVKPTNTKDYKHHYKDMIINNIDDYKEYNKDIFINNVMFKVLPNKFEPEVFAKIIAYNMIYYLYTTKAPDEFIEFIQAIHSVNNALYVILQKTGEFSYNYNLSYDDIVQLMDDFKNIYTDAIKFYKDKIINKIPISEKDCDRLDRTFQTYHERNQSQNLFHVQRYCRIIQKYCKALPIDMNKLLPISSIPGAQNTKYSSYQLYESINLLTEDFKSTKLSQFINSFEPEFKRQIEHFGKKLKLDLNSITDDDVIIINARNKSTAAKYMKKAFIFIIATDRGRHRITNVLTPTGYFQGLLNPEKPYGTITDTFDSFTGIIGTEWFLIVTGDDKTKTKYPKAQDKTLANHERLMHKVSTIQVIKRKLEELENIQTNILYDEPWYEPDFISSMLYKILISQLGFHGTYEFTNSLSRNKYNMMQDANIVVRRDFSTVRYSVAKEDVRKDIDTLVKKHKELLDKNTYLNVPFKEYMVMFHELSDDVKYPISYVLTDIIDYFKLLDIILRQYNNDERIIDAIKSK